MRRVDGERREDRKDVVQEIVFEPAGFGLGEFLAVDDDDALMQEIVLQLAPAALLVRGEHRHFRADPRQLLLRRQAVLRRRLDARADLPAQAGDAHHEELVEIVRRDREEAKLLEERMVSVRRLLEHAAVELEPGQLAVDEALRELPQGGAVEIDVGRRLRQRRIADDLDLVELQDLPHGSFPRIHPSRRLRTLFRDGFAPF